MKVLSTPAANHWILLRGYERRLIGPALRIRVMIEQSSSLQVQEMDPNGTAVNIVRELWKRSDGMACPELFAHAVEVFLARKIISGPAIDVAVESVRDVMRTLIDTRVDVG